MTAEMKPEGVFKTDEQRLSAIERTARRMEGPEGVDLDAVVKSAVAAYQQGRVRVGLPEPDWNRLPVLNVFETAAFYQKAVLQLDEYGWRGFATDAGLTILAGAVIVLTVLSPGNIRSGLESFAIATRLGPSRAQALVILVGGGLCMWLYSRGHLRKSIGAFAGGLAACALVWQFGFASALSTANTPAVDVLRTLVNLEAQRAALNLVLGWQQTGEFAPVTISREGFSLTTASASKANGVYYASARGIPGRMVANLSPSSGTLKWSDGKTDQQTNIFYGRIVDSTGETIVVDNGHEKVSVARGHAVLPPLSVGDTVVGAYDAKTREATAMIAVVPSKRPNSN
jgi:hypothetical protein